MDFPRSCSSLPQIILLWPVASIVSPYYLITFPKRFILTCMSIWAQSKGNSPRSIGFQLPTLAWLVQADAWHLIPLCVRGTVFLPEEPHWGQTWPLHWVAVRGKRGLLLPRLWILRVGAGEMMRQRAGERAQEWVGMRAISFCEMAETLIPVTDYHQQHMCFLRSLC